MKDGRVRLLLADESEDVIDIPTLNIVGGKDPYILGAMALYNMCDEDTAELFDHGKGHTVPRDHTTIKELCDAIERLVDRKEEWKDKVNMTAAAELSGDLETIMQNPEAKEGKVVAIPLPVGSK